MGVTLQVFSSGSIGNSYCLDANGEKLLIETGIPWKQILKSLNYNLDGIHGVILSHVHRDHIFSLPNAIAYGLKCYAPQSVCDIYPKCNVVVSRKRYKVGGFTVMPLKVPHGDCECVSYYLELPDGQKGVFATDCECFPYSIKGLNFILIECNNSKELIVDRLCDGCDARSSFNSHMELEETIKTINRLKSPTLNTVVLLHLSDSNSDEQMFKDRVFGETGIRPLVAKSKLIVELEKDDF